MSGIKRVFDAEPIRMLESNLDILPGEKPTDWIKRIKRETKKRNP